MCILLDLILGWWCVEHFRPMAFSYAKNNQRNMKPEDMLSRDQVFPFNVVDPRLDWLVMKKLVPVYWGRPDRSRHQWPLLCRGITWPGPPSYLCHCTCCSFWMKLNRPWSFWAWWENWFFNICNSTGDELKQYVCPNVKKNLFSMDIPKSLKKDPRSHKNQGVAQENNV